VCDVRRRLVACSARVGLAGALVFASLAGCSEGAVREAPLEEAEDAAADTHSRADSEDGSRALEVKPFMYTTPPLPVRILADGDPIELFRAPQGGHVLMVGARVAGLQSNTIELRARLRRASTRVIVAEELRTVVMETVVEEPSWKQTDRRTPTQVAHVAVCPNYDAEDVVGVAHELEVVVTELHGDFSTGSRSLRVVPSCVQPATAEREECVCECKANYTLGKCGATTGDAGPTPR
jgi:hypothetical protein